MLLMQASLIVCRRKLTMRMWHMAGSLHEVLTNSSQCLWLQLLRRLSDDLFEGGLDPKHTEDLVAVLVLACSAVDDR